MSRRRVPRCARDERPDRLAAYAAVAVALAIPLALAWIGGACR